MVIELDRIGLRFKQTKSTEFWRPDNGRTFTQHSVASRKAFRSYPKRAPCWSSPLGDHGHVDFVQAGWCGCPRSLCSSWCWSTVFSSISWCRTWAKVSVPPLGPRGWQRKLHTSYFSDKFSLLRYMPRFGLSASGLQFFFFGRIHWYAISYIYIYI